VDAFLVASASRPAGAPGAVQLAAQPSRRAPSTTVTDSSVSLVPIGCREKYGLAFEILMRAKDSAIFRSPLLLAG
jgi:hypothetical protein